MRVAVFIAFCGMLVCFTQGGETFDEMVKRSTRGTVPFIHAKELHDTLGKQKILLLDTRSKKEFNVSHIKGAHWVGEKNWPDSLYKVALNYKIVVCYCSVGARSEKTGEWLLKNRARNVKNLYGGIFAWSNARFPLVNKSGEKTEKVHPYSAAWSKWIRKSVIAYE